MLCKFSWPVNYHSVRFIVSAPCLSYPEKRSCTENSRIEEDSILDMESCFAITFLWSLSSIIFMDLYLTRAVSNQEHNYRKLEECASPIGNSINLHSYRSSVVWVLILARIWAYTTFPQNISLDYYRRRCHHSLCDVLIKPCIRLQTIASQLGSYDSYLIL